MNARQMERAAYIAAHRILTTDLTSPELACPGARRSAIVDNMARIIKSVYEAHNQLLDEATDWGPSEVPGVRLLIKHGRRPEKKRAAGALKL